MDIVINLESTVPVYKQIVHAIITGVQGETIESSTSLPSIRQLAKDLALTTATVSKSYQILQKNKIIVTGGRRGTFIAEDAPKQVTRYLQNELQWEVEEFIAKQMSYNIPLDQLEQTFRTVITEIKNGETL